ncbi:unnamed protein product [Cuscuta campestris]|uniref:Reverse transcriptase Ty1/copia-type domain-containing protein n=1 Tax=Cuscuta campestris TaxID=132261 RepID=A0A484MQG5_9ASTE|nr:unnamed protein product [Cuscuta campestris]
MTPGQPSWLAEPAALLTALAAATLGVAVERLAAGTAAAVVAADSRGAATVVVEAAVDADVDETLARNDTRMTATYLGTTHRNPTPARTQFTHDILERAGMTTCRPISTPVDTKAKLSGTSGTLAADPALYRSIVGALQYLTFTRPDISYSVQQLCLHLHAPRDVHVTAMKRVLRYLRGTSTYDIIGKVVSPTVPETHMVKNAPEQMMEVTLENHNDAASLILWDKECSDLLGMPAGAMKSMMDERNDDSSNIPKEIRDIVDMRALFCIYLKEAMENNSYVGGKSFGVSDLITDKTIISRYETIDLDDQFEQALIEHEKNGDALKMIGSNDVLKVLRDESISRKEVIDQADPVKKSLQDEFSSTAENKRLKAIKVEKE